MCERKQFTCKVIPGSASRGVVTWVGKGRKSVKNMLPTVCGCGQLGLNPLGALWETVLKMAQNYPHQVARELGYSSTSSLQSLAEGCTWKMLTPWHFRSALSTGPASSSD